jgi:hypothetical protein
MKHQTKQTLSIGAVIFASASFARADQIDFSGDAQHMLHALGIYFVLGCTVLAAGMVVAVVLWRKK